MSGSKPESVGTHYSRNQHLVAQARTRQALRLAVSEFSTGMSESEAHEVLKRTLADLGAENFWHPSKIRFGPNTTRSFREPSDPTQRLRNDDILFVDIGPVFGGHEGDYGETFIRGKVEAPWLALKQACDEIFVLCESAWKERGAKGSELYGIARAEARARGFELDGRMSGHRVGDFPHALHHKGSLVDFAASPSPGLWILEIHVVDLDRGIGAFREDLLV